MRRPRPRRRATSVDSVFPSWAHDFANDAVLVTFVQSSDVVTLRASPRLECTNVVHPTMVRADAVAWRPMACEATGVRGHLFTLSHQGRPTGRIEVTLGANDEIGKVVGGAARVLAADRRGADGLPEQPARL